MGGTDGELKRYRWTPGMLDVPFLFGAAGATELAGPSLIALLVGTGRGPSAAANLLTRMVAIRSLSVTRRGRLNVYSIDPASRERYAEVAGTRAGTAWTGAFDALVYNVPETSRTLRDRVLVEARSAGYGLLRPGVLIAAGDRTSRLGWDEKDFTRDAWLHHATLTPTDLAEARRMADRAWELPALARLYEAAIDRAERATASAAPDWATLSLWRDVYATFLDAQLKDPHLPAELLPRAWPGARFTTAQRALDHRLGTAVQPFVREISDRADTEGHNRYVESPWAAGD